MNRQIVWTKTLFTFMACTFHGLLSWSVRGFGALFPSEITAIERTKLAEHRILRAKFRLSQFLSGFGALLHSPIWSEKHLGQFRILFPSLCRSYPLRSHGLASTAYLDSIFNHKTLKISCVVPSNLGHHPSVASFFGDIPLKKILSGRFRHGIVI